MTKSSKKHLDRLHYADEDSQTVYVTVNSWMQAQATPHWAAKYYPGYEVKVVTEQYITERKNNER
jgi:hypothetical protein